MEYQPASFHHHGACRHHARPLDLREDRKQGERRAEREESNLRERDVEGRGGGSRPVAMPKCQRVEVARREVRR